MTLATPLSPAAHSAAFERFPVASLMNVTQRPPAVFTHGRGCWLWDSEGRAYKSIAAARSRSSPSSMRSMAARWRR